jgi:hypothetical protein
MTTNKPIPIVLDEVGQAMDRSTDDPCTPYLDLETGEVEHVIPGDMSGEPDVGPAIDEDPDRYLEIPRLESREKFRWMEQFADGLDDDRARDQLQGALGGKGAFRRFRDVLDRLPTQREAWLQALREHFVAEATSWLEAEQVAFIPKRLAVPAPATPAPPKPQRLPLRVAHVLLLGEPAEPPPPPWTARRIVHARGDNVRELFRTLVRDLCEIQGIAWRNRFVDGQTTYGAIDTRITIDGDRIVVDVVVPDPITKLLGTGRGASG